VTVIDLAQARAARIVRAGKAGQMLGYAVLDVETTGLRPGRYDRIVEIGIVRLDADLRETDSWTTLVDPERDIGSRAIHGISALQVQGAPKFTDIAGDVLLRLSNMVVVGHNVDFDLAFLRSEFNRCGWEVPGWDGLCTLELAALVGHSGSRNLTECCVAEGIDHPDAHAALADARAAAELLRVYLGRLGTLERNALTPPPVDPAACPAVAASGQARLRSEAPTSAQGSSLQAFVRRLPAAIPAVEADPTAVLGYVDLLDRVVEDRSISVDEAEALADFATSHELTLDTVSDIHRSYLTSLVAIALRDGEVTDIEQDDLTRVAGVLGVAELLEALLRAAGPSVRAALVALRGIAHAASPEHSPVPPIDRRAEFRGKRVCFTGESVCEFDRETQEILAAGAGLVVMPRVTRALDLLVLADPASQSTKRRTAERYGLRMIAERAFWPAVGITID
jgi:DNA polymerase-3 subunit epsilon